MNSNLVRFCCLTIFLFSCSRPVPFNSKKWKEAGGELIMTKERLSMTNDLLKSKVLLNKTKNEIDSILGFSFRLHNGDKNKTYYKIHEVYTWHDIDPIELIFLEFEFNEDNISSSVEMIRK